MTQVRIAREVKCPFSAALEFAERIAKRKDGLYLTPSPPLGERVRMAAQTTSDATDDARKHDALLIAWRPQNPDMFPEFRGVLTVRPHLHGSRLHLAGQYEPPYGVPGKAFDFVAGRAIARHTLQRFLDELAVEIEAEYQQERQQTGVVRV